MTLVDSSVWIAYFNGENTPQTRLLDNLLNEEIVLMGDLILTEVLQGFSKEEDFLLAREALSNLECVTHGGPEIALASARNFRALRRKGITVRKTIDVLIGTFCIENQIPLLHADRDFDPMALHLGLMVVDTI
ncbi:MAG: PIN domain nuclease [Calditrichaeota bacterium]|nr:PIN domain nuclease [Calditrichota bacterium]